MDGTPHNLASLDEMTGSGGRSPANQSHRISRLNQTRTLAGPCRRVAAVGESSPAGTDPDWRTDTC